MPLRYAVDVHGTLACRRPDGTLGRSTLFPLLEPLMRALVAKGEKVYILSGPPTGIIEQEVKELGLRREVHYSRLLSMVDWLRAKDVSMQEDPPGSGHWWTDDATWNAVKGDIAQAFRIDILIDDQAEYVGAMPEGTEFVLIEASLLGCSCERKE